MPESPIELTARDLDDLITSLDYSIRNVAAWHAGPQGSAETAGVGKENVARLEALRDKLRAMKRASRA